MAEQVFNGGFLTLAAVDLTAYVESMRLRYSADAPETTDGNVTTRKRLGGLLDWSVEIAFNQDYAAAKVDATLFALVGTSIAVALRPNSAAQSATNPTFSGNAILTEYPPLDAQVGAVIKATISLQGNGVLTRTAV